MEKVSKWKRLKRLVNGKGWFAVKQPPIFNFHN